MRAQTNRHIARALVVAGTLLGLVVLAWAARSSTPADAAATCSNTLGIATVQLDQSTAGALTSLAQDGSGNLVVNGTACGSGFPTVINLAVTAGQPAPSVSLNQTGAGGVFPCTTTIQGNVGSGDVIVAGAASENITAGDTPGGSGVNLNSCSSVGTIQSVHSYTLVAGTGAIVLSAAGGAPFSGALTVPATMQANAASSQTFHQGAVQDTIDFSSLTGSLTVNESGAPAGPTANHAATSGANSYTFDGPAGGTAFLGSQAPTTFLAGTAPDTFQGHDPGHDTLSYAAASGSALHVCVAAASGCTAGEAVLGATAEPFSGISSFVGLTSGNTTFVAAATGGYGFTGTGTGNVLDASATPAGSVVDANAGTASGLTGGGQDTFTGLSTFVGSSAGDTAFVAGSTNETFIDPAAAAGDSIDFSHVATTPSTQLGVNVTGGPVSFGGNTVANHTASVGTTTYTFTTGGAGFTSFTGAAGGNTAFLAGSTGGNTFSGQSSGNTLDASATPSGITIDADTGAVTGLTSGGSDTFTGIATLTGSSAGHTTFVVGGASLTLQQVGVSNTIDFSALQAAVTVNRSGAVASGVANNTATSGGHTYTFTSFGTTPTTFDGSPAGSTFVAGTTADSFNGGSGIDTLDYSAASGSPLHVCVAATSGCAAGVATLGAVQEQFSGIESFTGLAGGNTTFVAPATGGYTFTGLGSGDALDASATPAATTIDASTGKVSGLTGGAQDTFTGISTLMGSSAGDTTFIAGSSHEAFLNPTAASGDAIDFSHVPTSGGAPLSINVSGGPVTGTDGSFVPNASAGSTYTFTAGSPFAFIGATSGNTALYAGSTGGYSLTGHASGNRLDLTAASTGMTIDANAGTVTGLTSGGDDTFTGISTLIGSAAGSTTFIAPVTGGYVFDGVANGNVLDVTAAAGGAAIDTVNHVVTGLAGNSIDNFVDIASFREALRFTSTPKVLTVVGDTYVPAVTSTQSTQPLTLDVDATTTNSACHLAAANVLFDHAGICVVAANQAGDGQFLDAPQLLQQIQVSPSTTTTVLSAQPTGPVASGTPVTLSATVSPAVAGNVQFRDGAADVGAPVPVSGGVASTTLTLPNARHALTARFVPQATADYLTSTSDIVTFVVDGTAPSVQVTRAGGTPTSSTTAELAFSASDADSPSVSFTCRLDAGPESACTSPWSLTGLGDGAHTFNVTAADGVGNSGHAATSWTVDTVKPTASLTTPAGPALLTAVTAVRWTATDGTGTGVAAYQLRFRQAKWNGGFGGWSTPSSWQHLTTSSVSATVPLGYTRCFSVLAIDKAGNMSGWSASRCTSRPLDDRSLTASGAWTRKKAPSYYFGTYTAAVAKGAKLTLSNAHLDRVGVVATTCPTCGRVEILVKSKVIGTINLHSAKTRHRVSLSLPPFSRRIGTVTLEVVTSGRSVQIDGLLVSAA